MGIRVVPCRHLQFRRCSSLLSIRLSFLCELELRWILKAIELAITNLDRSRLAARNIKIARPSLLGYIETREEFKFYADELFRLIAEEKFTVRIHEVYPLKEVARAHNVSTFGCGLPFGLT